MPGVHARDDQFAAILPTERVAPPPIPFLNAIVVNIRKDPPRRCRSGAELGLVRPSRASAEGAQRSAREE